MRDPDGSMPLTLVTGPANAEKAGHVLAAYRAVLDREPLLVVPTAADVERYRRELAAAGAVFGVQVLRFGWLEREVARRAAVPGRPVGPLARERVAAVAIAATALDRLAPSAATPGFLPAFLGLVDELEERRISPGRWYAALRAWAAEAPAQSAYAEELAALYGAYRDGLERLGRRDARLHTVEALDRLRLEPARWGKTPVLLYGFDDLTPQQRDTVETLAVHCGADVTVSLTYEPGRTAFAGRGATFQELLALGAEHVPLEASADHYASLGLHDLERGLFEAGVAPFDPGGGVVLLEGGGERAELELVAAHVARLHPRGALRARGDRGRPAQPGRERGADRGRLRGGGDPDRTLAPSRRRPHGPRPRRARPAALRGPRRHARRPARVAAHARQARAPGGRRPPRGRARGRPVRGPRPRRGRCGRPRIPTSRWPSSTASPRPTPPAPRRCASGSRPRRAALFAAPHRGAAPVLTGSAALDARVAGALRARPRRARHPRRPRPGSRAVGRGARAHARAPRGLRGRRRSRGHARGGRGHLAARGSGRAACGRCSSAACRRACSRAPAAPSRSSATPSAARSTRPRACAWRCVRTSSPASGSSSTPRSRARRTCSGCRWHAADDEGEPRVPLAVRRRRPRPARPRAGGRPARRSARPGSTRRWPRTSARCCASASRRRASPAAARPRRSPR